MNKKSISTLILLVLAFSIWIFRDSGLFDKEIKGVLNRHPSELVYTKHAKCRMECRQFTKREVREILENGKLNNRKSRPYDKPCPSYALEGVTSDGQEARMIFATCDNDKLKVVTCIDLKTDYKCNCY